MSALDLTWMAKAACRGSDEVSFFNDHYNNNSKIKKIKEAEARALCGRCPVQPDCLEYAVVTVQQSGIWGGTDEDERIQIRRSRREMSLS